MKGGFVFISVLALTCGQDCGSDWTVVEIQNEHAKMVDDLVFPLTLGPKHDNGALAISESKDWILEKARVHGAVLLRGFELTTAEDFGEVVLGLKLENMPYVGGAAVRRNIVGDFVFTANESPPSQPIPFHHEMAQVSNPPRYVMFYCEIAPDSGGETPIIISRKVQEFFETNHPQVAEKVAAQGVRYVRTMPEEDDVTSAIGRSWKNTFLVNSVDEAEAKMRSMGTEWEWLPNGDLKTITNVVPAVRGEPLTNRRTFFNSIVAAFTGWVDARNDPTKSVVYADGSPIEADAILSVAEYMKRERAIIPWHKGDVLIVDNSVTMHSRNTYDSPRRVLASVARQALSGPAFSSSDIQKAAVGDMQVTVRLPNGDFMPKLAMGLWQVPKELTGDTVYNAILAGVRHFDCACDYGNEAEVGVGIQRAIQDRLVSRSDLFIVSKLWNTYHGVRVEDALRRTLEDLRLEYVDMYMIHFPIAQKFVPFEKRYPPEWFFDPDSEFPRIELANIPLQSTWREMESMVVKGLTKSIGVCNFNVQLLRDVISYAKFPVSALQVEIHPLNSQVQLVEFAQSHGIQVVGFSTMGPSSYGSGESLLESETLKAIASVAGCTPAQVLIRWELQRRIAPIFKSTKMERIKENLNSVQCQLFDKDMASIDALNKNQRFNDPGVFALKQFKTVLPLYE